MKFTSNVWIQRDDHEVADDTTNELGNKESRY